MKIQIEILNVGDVCIHRTILADKKDKEWSEGKTLVSHPTIILISGKQVISKSIERDGTIIQRVSSNDSLYYSCDDESKEISFVRKDWIESEIEPFSKVISIKICSKIDDLVIEKTISEFYGNTFTVKNILRYNDDSKLILSHLIKKIEIPLVVSLFLILLINFFVNSHFSQMNNSLQMELMKNKRTISNANSKLNEILKLKTENTPRRCMDASILIDALASQIPDGITINYIAIDPMKRKVETKKPLNTEKNTIVIKGETLSANDITEMTNRMERLDFSKNLKIKNIEQNRDNDILKFEIEITY